MNKLIIDLCQRVVNDRRLNTRDFNYCDGINCDRDNCPFVIGTKCNITEPIGIEIAKQYLKDNKIKVENKMEKTFREVIADIKEGEVWENSLRRIELLNGDIQISRINGKEFNTHILQFSKSITYKLKRNKYNFNEAFKAYEEGKEIESIFSGIKYKKKDEECYMWFSDTVGEWEEEEILNLDFTYKEIRSTWYIND